MIDQKQLIIIKGTREGLTLFIDDTCSFEEALRELNEKLDLNRPQKDEPSVPVKIKLGDRYLRQEQQEQLKHMIEAKNHFQVESLDSNVVLREDALKWKEDMQIKTYNRLVRSGQVLKVKGDLLLIGDVNPGGMVMSTGNIFILGSLYGTAHAGVNGDRKAVIVASYMKPTQLRIADYISRAPDYDSSGVYMECGFIDEEKDKILINRLQVLTYLRKDLSGFERRIQNG